MLRGSNTLGCAHLAALLLSCACLNRLATADELEARITSPSTEVNQMARSNAAPLVRSMVGAPPTDASSSHFLLEIPLSASSLCSAAARGERLKEVFTAPDDQTCYWRVDLDTSTPSDGCLLPDHFSTRTSNEYSSDVFSTKSCQPSQATSSIYFFASSVSGRIRSFRYKLNIFSGSASSALFLVKQRITSLLARWGWTLPDNVDRAIDDERPTRQNTGGIDYLFAKEDGDIARYDLTVLLPIANLTDEDPAVAKECHPGGACNYVLSYP